MKRIGWWGMVCLCLLGCQGQPAREAAALPGPPLRVCAGENELPYSNRAGEGFENAIARELGQALRRRVEFVWWRDARFVVRNYLDAGKCDVIIGVDADNPLVETTTPYYRSGYVFVTRKGVTVRDWDDPLLQQAGRIAFVPYSPAEIMLRKIGRYADMFFYMNELVDFKSRRNKYVRWEPKRLIGDVLSGKAEVGVLWAPEAARYVRDADGRLQMQLIPDHQTDRRGDPVPQHYSVALGVRKGDGSLRQALQRALEKQRYAIRAILEAEGIPLLPLDEKTASR
ncbi:mxaJ protein [Methylomarinovum tepidoasis]|uniref:MxaJ protein n=1 Tax=Methylomarinovum tepidoasis TaxID=2840183 RepID=A0AAU9CEL6_9GAMM|nr:methanol oxidation system protein MoxJ [Methylomarinovum sp. IN45]BCX89251.1 mxaJ protein [Methylomarinovum sp. IN45]